MHEGPECWLRMGSHSEKEYFLKTGRLFSGVVFNANLVAATPAATASLAIRMDKSDVKYWIDPYTYPFAQDPAWIKSKNKKTGEVRVKRTFQLLAEAYGPPVANALAADRPVKRDDFASDGVVREFAEAVLHYQTDHLREELDKDDAATFVSVAAPPPAFVVSPYFLIGTTRTWQDTCERLAQAFCTAATGHNRMASLCIADELLDSESIIGDIGQAWGDIDCDGYVLWVSNMDECAISLARLENLRELVVQLAAGGRQVYNAHGGYLSAFCMSSA